MIQGKDIICLSSIDWDFSWQPPQEVMSRLAQHNRVLFVETLGFRRPLPRDFPRIVKRLLKWMKGPTVVEVDGAELFVYSPVIPSLPRWRLTRRLNRWLLESTLKRLMLRLRMRRPILWVYLPTRVVLDVATTLDREIVVYHCIDNVTEVPYAPSDAAEVERSLTECADIVFTSSQSLYQAKRPLNPMTVLAMNAVNFGKFTRPVSIVPPELRGLPRPIIGLVGSINRRVDLGMLKALAMDHPDWSLLVVGPVQQLEDRSLRRLRNVHFVGQRPFDSLPDYIDACDACVIPYKRSRYSDSVFPVKMNEYHARGKPVVSSVLPEVAAFNRLNGNIVYICDDEASFVRQVERALAEDSSERRAARIAVARANSWEERIEEMTEAVEKTLLTRHHVEVVSWWIKVGRLYRRSRQLTLGTILTGLTCFVLLYYTPLVWVAASPLRIDSPPRRADVIAVFGGGVGEGGRPRSSTVERARFAVELYQQGYAQTIIFSGGYSYKASDAENMRLVALAMGVPGGAMVIDNLANSAYENVRNVSDILRARGWKSALVVSSPYNMRRVSLVFQKWGRGLEITYTPVRSPQFYHPAKGKRWDQIQALLQEYVGIAYYWLKGYI